MGQAIASRLIADGMTVIAAGRNEDELRAFANLSGAEHGVADITSADDLASLFGEIAKRHGGVDVAVNATGSGLLVPLLDMTVEQLEHITRLQFMGSILFYQAALRVMRDSGNVIQISSATATIMLEDHAAYMGTKAGADHVIRTIANEFGTRGIRANSVSPGFTDTPMTARAAANPALVAAFEQEYPLGRVNTKDDIANAVSWIVSNECFMTGQNFQVNGGLTLRRNPRNAELAAAVRAARAAAS
jgi:2-hydroxycyclohexanecarboxyl-CoA dehydrogenase